MATTGRLKVPGASPNACGRLCGCGRLPGACDLAVAGGIFGLLCPHTGELALGIGAHFGALYSDIVVGSILQVTGSPSGLFGVLDQHGLPTMLVAYVALVGWLLWRHGGLPVRSDIARWSGK